MNAEYIYEVINRILSQRVIQEPNCATWLDVVKAISADARKCIEQLIHDQRVYYRENLNSNTLIYLNDETTNSH